MSTGNEELVFEKYERRGAYHWGQISRSLRRHNAVVSARYASVVAAVEPAADLTKPAGFSVLDIGGGDGVLSYLLAQAGAQPVTLDLSLTALRYAGQEFTRRGQTLHPAQASAYALPFSADSFAVVVCAEVIEHVQQPERLLEEARRVLRPGGRLVLTTPLRGSEAPFDAAHVREYFAGELRDLLEAIFAGVQIRAEAPLALVELFRLRISWLFGRPLFRYLFNASALYLGRNPFRRSDPFLFQSLLVAVAHKPTGELP